MVTEIRMYYNSYLCKVKMCLINNKGDESNLDGNAPDQIPKFSERFVLEDDGKELLDILRKSYRGSTIEIEFVGTEHSFHSMKKICQNYSDIKLCQSKTQRILECDEISSNIKESVQSLKEQGFNIDAEEEIKKIFDATIMDNIVCLKNTYEDFEVEFEVQPPIIFAQHLDERQQKIVEGIASVDEQLCEVEFVLDKLNAEIDRLTCHADGIDYAVAVGSGVLAGIIDIVFVEDFSLETANTSGNEKANKLVVKIAQFQGYTGDDVVGAIKFLEDKYPIAADKVTNDFGGGRQHHLRDFSHHPTPVGLLFSLLTQFTHKVYGTDTAGIFKIVELKGDDLILIGKNLPEKITFGVVNWFFHMISDMAGSSSSVANGKVGTGLPGPIGALLKELSALPIFKKVNENGYKEFSVWVSKLFNGTLLGKHDENGKLIEPIKFDLRTEIGVAEQLGKQAIPVIINECVVRGFYFIRRFCIELQNNDIKSFAELNKVNWKNTVPFNNRTIARMITISTGTMTAIDLADAAIESAVKSGGVGPAFVSNMIVKVNFVGVGRFAIAVATDVSMGIKRSKNRNERIIVMNEKIFLLNAKTFYKQADVWVAAENAGETINEAYNMMEETSKAFAMAYQDIKDSLHKINDYIPGIEKNNLELIKTMKDILEWG